VRGQSGWLRRDLDDHRLFSAFRNGPWWNFGCDSLSALVTQRLDDPVRPLPSPQGDSILLGKSEDDLANQGHLLGLGRLWVFRVEGPDWLPEPLVVLGRQCVNASMRSASTASGVGKLLATRAVLHSAASSHRSEDLGQA